LLGGGGGGSFCVEEPETAPAGYTRTINKSLNLMILFMPPARRFLYILKTRWNITAAAIYGLLRRLYIIIEV